MTWREQEVHLKPQQFLTGTGTGVQSFSLDKPITPLEASKDGLDAGELKKLRSIRFDLRSKVLDQLTESSVLAAMQASGVTSVLAAMRASGVTSNGGTCGRWQPNGARKSIHRVALSVSQLMRLRRLPQSQTKTR